MTRARPDNTQTIGVTEISPILQYLQKHGIGAQEIRAAWQNKGGLDALVAYTRTRIAQQTTRYDTEPVMPPLEENRTTINSWEEFLHHWGTCRTHYEAIGLLIACGSDTRGFSYSVYKAGIPIPWNDQYEEYKKNQWHIRFSFLVGVALNDPAMTVREVASHVLWERFLLQLGWPYAGIFWQEIRDVAFWEALDWVSTQSLSANPENVLRFLLCVAGYMILNKGRLSNADFISVVAPRLKDCYILATKVLEATRIYSPILPRLVIRNEWTPKIYSLYFSTFFKELGLKDPDECDEDEPFTPVQFAKALVAFFDKEIHGQSAQLV
jgi:hypothetical protein